MPPLGHEAVELDRPFEAYGAASTLASTKSAETVPICTTSSLRQSWTRKSEAGMPGNIVSSSMAVMGACVPRAGSMSLTASP